jgi:hypothetical protein
MSDRRTVTIEASQFNRLDLLFSTIINALWAINEQLKPIDNAINNQTTEITKWQSLQKEAIEAGFEKVAQAIANIQPLPKPPGPPAKVGSVKFVFPGLKESE